MAQLYIESGSEAASKQAWHGAFHGSLLLLAVGMLKAGAVKVSRTGNDQ